MICPNHATFEGGNWRVPTDAHMTSLPLKSQADKYTDQRRGLQWKLLAPMSATYTQMTAFAIYVYVADIGASSFHNKRRLWSVY